MGVEDLESTALLHCKTSATAAIICFPRHTSTAGCSGRSSALFALILIDHVIGCEYKWMAIGYNLATNNFQSIPTYKIHKYSDIEISKFSIYSNT